MGQASMDDLVAWLRGVLDEHERTARHVVDMLGKPGSLHLTGGTTAVLWRRQLADIRAKRTILDQYETHHTFGPHDAARGLGRAVRTLASAYADRPGYRDEWRPATQ